MKRHASLMLVFIGVGIILNIAGPWALARWLPFAPASQIYAFHDDPNLAEGRNYWQLSAYVAFGSDRLVAMVRRSGGDRAFEQTSEIVPAWSDLPAYLHARTAEPKGRREGQTTVRPYFPCVVVEEARGWPLRCLWWRCDRGDADEPWVGAIEMAPLQPDQPGSVSIDGLRALPLRPLYLGFAVNSLLYGGMLWLMIFGPGALRRTLRRRRHACPWCGYPRGESSICTECGSPVATQPVSGETWHRRGASLLDTERNGDLARPIAGRAEVTQHDARVPADAHS